MKGPRHWGSLDLPGRFTWVQPFLMRLCMSTKTLIKNLNKLFQPALPNFREAGGFSLNRPAIQRVILCALRPNNVNNENKDKSLKGGLMCWCFQVLRQQSEQGLGKKAKRLHQERYSRNQTDQRAASGVRLLQRATTGKDAQPGKIQKRVKTIKRVKSY